MWWIARDTVAGQGTKRALTAGLAALSLAAACMPAAAQTATEEPQAPAADTAAVIAVMDRLFDAMRTRDTAAIRAIAHPDLRLFVLVSAAAGNALRTVTIDQFIESVGAANALLDERAFRPEVRIDGDLATIWTYYEFRRGGTFSHCGHDAFQLARTAEGWKIVGLAYTSRQHGCLDEWDRSLH